MVTRILRQVGGFVSPGRSVTGEWWIRYCSNTHEIRLCGNLLDKVQQDFYHSQKLAMDRQKPTKLKSFGRAIHDVSRSIELIGSAIFVMLKKW